MSNPTKKSGPSQIDDRRAKLFDAARPLLPGILSLHEKWLGEKDALICDDARLSWSAFGEATNRVANGLRALGLQPGDTVGVVMHNSPEMIETLFGVMKAGCVSAPLNLTVSDDALTGMLIDADVRAVIASSDQIARLEKCCADEGLKDIVRIGCPHGDGRWLAYGQWKQQQDTASPKVAIAPDDVFNIIYSSGTTGRPKGIVHTHQTRLDWAYDLAIALRYHNAARTICTLSLYSNISWVMMLCTLLAGGTLIVSRKFDAAAFLDGVARYKATHTALVPVQLQRILDHPDFSQDKVASMQAIMSCGSPLHESLKRRVFEGFPCGVIELYGLTEGVITTLQPEEAEGRMSSVGKPLLGTDLKIIGDDEQEVPRGASGEIVSRGRIVMPGYHNRPDASEEAVWCDADGRAWLRTGDIGRLDDEGYLYIVDRKKDMILSGGQNIFPADIESVLLTHPTVKDAAVIGVPHAEWGESPFAVIEADGAPEPQELVGWLNARVGKRQRVIGLEIVDALPRNPNGKILKRALRDQFRAVS